MARRTLSFRLIASSVVWVSASLLATGVLLVLLFRNHIERRFDARLRDHIDELVAASDVAPDGSFELTLPEFTKKPSPGGTETLALNKTPLDALMEGSFMVV